VKWRFNPPPGWPGQPPDWAPAPDWVPDPAWPPAPVGWRFWVPGRSASGRQAAAGALRTAAYAIVGALGAAVIGVCAFLLSLLD
jgi:hypothetical protein